MKEIPYFCIYKEKRYLCLYLFDKTGQKYVHKNELIDMQKNDNLWKGILEDILDDFLRFMHPNADEIFDFGQGVTFLDKELEQLFPPEKDKFSTKIVDKLAKLYTRSGKEKWVLIHCEVQGKYNVDFPLRMFTYYYRIFDKYRRRISAYAILTEETQKLRTENYTTGFLGTELKFRYNVYKILQQSEAELLKSDNPFAMVALTVRSVLKKKNLDDDALMEIKLKLSRLLLQKSFPKVKIRKIMTFLKCYIHFENAEKNIIFDKKLEQITGRTKTMGIEQQVLDMAKKRGMELGEERGIELGKKEIIINMIQKNTTDETIADLANVPIDYVQKIRASLN
jgi:predicted transposase YdaD